MDEVSQRLKCRIRIGSAEIELEGTGTVDSRVTEKLLELMDLFEDAVTSPTNLDEIDAEAAEEKEEIASAGQEKKKDARGGRRQPFISKNIKELGMKGKIVNVTVAEVSGMLIELYGLNVEEDSVYAALKRGLGKSLTRVGSTPKDSRFTYIGEKKAPTANEPPASSP